MGVDKLVGARARERATDHAAVQKKGRSVIRMRSISSDHRSVEVDVGGFEVVEDEASVGEIGEGESAEAEKLEGVEMSLAMAESDEKSLELLEMIEMNAPFKEGEDMVVQILGRNHVLVFFRTVMAL